MIVDFALCARLFTNESGFCLPPDFCWTREFPGVDTASFTSTVPWGTPPPGAGDLSIPRTLLSYLNGVSTIAEQFSGIDLNSCEEGPVAVNYWHEEQQTLTLLTTSMGAPVLVDGPREDAKQNQKSMLQNLGPITSADNDIKLPSATPGSPLLIGSLSETALKATVTPVVLVPLQAETYERALPYFNSNQSPKGLLRGRPTNVWKEESTIISPQAGKLTSAQDSKPIPIYGPPTRTQQAEKSVPVPTILPYSASFRNSDQLPKLSKNKQTKNNFDPPLNEPAEIKGLNNEKVAGFQEDKTSSNDLELASKETIEEDGKEASVPRKIPVVADTTTHNDLGLALEDNVRFKKDDREETAALNENPILVPWIIVDGSSVPLATPSSPPPNSLVHEIRIGSSTFQVVDKSKSGLIIESQTLLPGEVATIQNIPVSVLPFVPTLAIGTNTITLSPLVAPTPGSRLQTITLDSTSFVVSQLSSLAIVIDSQTLTAGGVITAKGIPVSLLNAHNAFVVGDRTLSIPSLPTLAPAFPTNEAVINSLTFPVLRLPSSAILIGSQTLVPGSKIIVQGIPVSLLPGNNELLVAGKKTVNLRPLTAASQTSLPVKGEVIIDLTTFNYSILSPSSIQIGSQILKAGSGIMINGHHVSFMPSPSIPPVTMEKNIILRPKLKVADDTFVFQTITLGKDKDNLIILTRAPSFPGVLIGAQTLTPGSAIVYHDQTISLPTSASVIVVRNTTFSLPPLPPGSQVKVTEAESNSGFTMTRKSDHQPPSPTSSMTSDRQDTQSPPTTSRIMTAQPTTTTTTGVAAFTNSAGGNRFLKSWRSWSSSWIIVIFLGGWVLAH